MKHYKAIIKDLLSGKTHSFVYPSTKSEYLEKGYRLIGKLYQMDRFTSVKIIPL